MLILEEEGGVGGVIRIQLTLFYALVVFAFCENVRIAFEI